MRKLILNLAVSLDGFIEGPNGEYDWCFTDLDYGMTDFLNRTDAIFFGRKSYELLLSTDDNPYPDKAKYVFSKTLSLVAKAAVISHNIEENIKEIKNAEGKDIWLFGGASLTSELMRLNLIDELQLSIHPILLGEGKPLFQNMKERTGLILIKNQNYPTGLVQLTYAFK